MLVLERLALLQGLQRWPHDIIPRKMEFKGWVTDYTSSFQGITFDEVVLFIVDLQKMVPNEFHQYIDWHQTRREQGNRPTKAIVNMWFENETNLATMSGLLKVVKDELKEVRYKIHDQEVSARLEMSPHKTPLAKAHALFYKGLKAVGGYRSMINVVYGKIQMSFFVDGAMAAKFTPEGEGLAGEGWNIKPVVISEICTEFSEALFEAIVQSS